MADTAGDRKEFKIAGKAQNRESGGDRAPHCPRSPKGSENHILADLASEEFVIDKATGVKLNTNMFEYMKPTILDIGPCKTILVEMRSGNAAYGSTGISHAMATMQLIIGAVANAIGKWLPPPLTPDKILKTLGKA